MRRLIDGFVDDRIDDVAYVHRLSMMSYWKTLTMCFEQSFEKEMVLCCVVFVRNIVKDYLCHLYYVRLSLGRVIDQLRGRNIDKRNSSKKVSEKIIETLLIVSCRLSKVGRTTAHESLTYKENLIKKAC